MKILKIIACVVAALLAVTAVTGVIVAVTNSSSPDNPANPTDCKGDLHFLNEDGVCANCKGQAPTFIRLNTYKVETYFTDGDGYQLSCSFLPENTTLTKIFWKSSDENVATVDNNGYVTYVGNGTAHIYATPVTGEELTNICEFKLTRRIPDLSLVFEKDKYYVDTFYIESDLLNTDTVRIYENGSANMPEDGNFEWASSDENVVKILLATKKTCSIQYVGEGSATITATASNGAVATADVYVGTRLNISIGTTMNPCPVHIGDRVALVCDWLPEKLVTDSVKTFRSSNENVLTIDRDGYGTIVGYGEVTITAETGSSSTAVNASVTYEFVSYDVTKLQLLKDGSFMGDSTDERYLTMAANTPPADIAEEYPNTVQLSVSIIPWYAENKSIVWTSSNKNVVTVDDTGLVTAIGGGTATITAIAHNGLSISCNVSVTMFAKSVTLTGYEVMDDYSNATECKMFVGDSIQLDKQVLPENNNDIRVETAVWHSMNTDIATIDENGVVTAVGTGKTKVGLIPIWGNLVRGAFATVDIIVIEPIESVSFDIDRINLDYSQGIQKIDDNHFTLGKDGSLTLPTQTIGGSVYEETNIKDRLHYSSSNKDVVSVSSAGVIRAKDLGDSVITVTTDSGKSASVTVTVTFFAQSIEMQDITMSVGDSVVLPVGVVPEKSTPYLGISYDGQYVDITSDYVFDNGELYLGQDITITAKQVGSCSVTIDACGPFDANDPETQSSVTFTITINAARANLENCSWEDIANYSLSGQASNAFRVGDEKQVQLTDGENLTFVILGFNHDDIGSGNKAGISFGLKGLMAETSSMQVDLSAIFLKLPQDLQNVIQTVRKYEMEGNKSENVIVCWQKLWLFAEVEIDGTSRTGYCDEGSQYAYWSRVLDGTDRNDRILSIDGVAKDYWLRSPSNTSADCYGYVGSNGNIYASAKQTNSYGVCFGFCV